MIGSVKGIDAYREISKLLSEHKRKSAFTSSNRSDKKTPGKSTFNEILEKMMKK